MGCNRTSGTVDQLGELVASGGLGGLAPPGAFAVADLVAGDLAVLAAERRRLPPQHDALRGEREEGGASSHV